MPGEPSSGLNSRTTPSVSPSAGAPPSPSASDGPHDTELVTRPDPGLARGRWEAPAWAFWVALALVLTGATLYLLRHNGKLRRGKAPR